MILCTMRLKEIGLILMNIIFTEIEFIMNLVF